jgi:two-component system, chemotaxis family, sensor kinase CheA
MAEFLRDDEQLDLLRGFVEEGLEMLEEVEPKLIEMEKGSSDSGAVDPEVLNSIFRLFHSLKGSAGYLGLATISRTTHTAETLLDLFRKGTATLSSHHVDLLIKSCDFIRLLLEEVGSRQSDQGHDPEADEVIQLLGAAIADIQSGATDRTPKKNGKRKASAKATPAPKITPEVKPTNNDSGSSVIATADMAHQFQMEAQELLDQAEQALLALEKEPENSAYISQAFRALHSFKGNCGMFGFSDMERLSHQSETVLEGIKAGENAATQDVISLLLEILDELKGNLLLVSEGQAAKIQGLLGWISLLQDCMKCTGVAAAKTPSDPEKPESAANEVRTSEAEAAEIERLLNSAEEVVADSPPAKTPVPERREEGERRTGEDRRRQENTTTQRQSVRVDVEKLDGLLDLVGELVIAEAMVAQNPELRSSGISLDRFDRSVMHLEKISRDMQDIITSIRMIPLSGTFRKMIRLVRDLSVKAGKQIELEIIGEETEVDKTVIEQINDPLVHLIRNSIDHGIETPQARIAAGKPEIGRVVLEAKYMGSEVWILIRDDGKGLDRDRILAKAVEKGLVSAEAGELPDEEVYPLIFQPGFSTADKITDVSGRGVGTDVVKRNIEALRGKVDVRSDPGQGCVFMLRLPLTLAIIDGMIVKVGRDRFIIPIVSIKETLQAKESDITRLMDGQEIISIRGTLIPVVRLHEIFKIETRAKSLSEGLILVVENEGRNLCLLVDELIGQQQIVIKGLSRYIGDLQGISGCTILGDGDISLIIDIAGIFDQAGISIGNNSRREPLRLNSISPTINQSAMI